MSFCAVNRHPDGALRRSHIRCSTLDAAMLGDPHFGGVCPGYERVGFAMRVDGGWWRIKGQAVQQAPASIARLPFHVAQQELQALAALIRRPPIDDVMLDQGVALRIAEAIDLIVGVAA